MALAMEEVLEQADKGIIRGWVILGAFGVIGLTYLSAAGKDAMPTLTLVGVVATIWLLLGAWAGVPRVRPHKCANWFCWFLALNVLVLISIPLTSWPLKLSIAFGQKELVRIHEAALRGETVGPIRVGLLDIQEVRSVGRKRHYLVLDARPSGMIALARDPEPPLNPWVTVGTGSGWTFFVED